MNKTPSVISYKLYLNDHFIFPLHDDENYSYKIFSEERIALEIIVNSGRFTRSIDVKNGNSYYFEINGFSGKYE